MLATSSIVDAVTSHLASRANGHAIPVVLDPVLYASSGLPLLDADGVAGLSRIFPLISWITPNTEELSILTGLEIAGVKGVEDAAEALQRRYPNLNVVVTGGHLASPDDYLLTTAGEKRWFAGSRIDTTSTHGTGCAFSSALLCRLVLGDGPIEAVAGAKAYVAEAIRTAPGLGQGRGPLNLLWPLRR